MEALSRAWRAVMDSLNFSDFPRTELFGFAVFALFLLFAPWWSPATTASG